jgi:PBSX family phage terminase large subunit
MEQYAELGKKWLAGELNISEFQGIKLNAKQKAFVNSRERYSTISGGFASGKTTAFIVKLILLAVFFPGNRILLGRKTKMDVEQATLPDFFDICPPEFYEYKVGPGIIEFKNGSQIIIMGLDALQSGAGQDIKKAEQKIKSLNLGAVFIDQLEEIEYRVFEALTGRLRRNVGFQQMNFCTNPANFWAYDFFKAHPQPNTSLVETSMLDNKDNLPEQFIKDQLSRPKRYVERYVYGKWDTDIMVESAVFADEYRNEQRLFIKKPIREFDGIKVFEEPGKKEYFIGVDPSDGSVDPCAIVVVASDGGVCATYSAYVPHSVIAEKAVQLAYMYSQWKKPLIIPESTGAGQALIELLKPKYERIYEREVFNQREKKEINKLGFSTNYASKKLLIEHMIELFQQKIPTLRDHYIVEEMNTFIYSDEVKQKGAGAQNNFHDDRLMATMLAFWPIKAAQRPKKKLGNILDRQNDKNMVKYKKYQFN